MILCYVRKVFLAFQIWTQGMSKTEYGRTRASSNNNSIHLPQTNSAVGLQFPRSISLGFITGAEMKEKQVFKDETAPPKALWLLSLYSNIQSPDLQICSLFSCYCPFFTFALLFVTCICRQRSKVSNPNALRLSLFFCLLWSPPPPFSYLSILPRMAIYGFLLDSVCQTASFKQGKGTHVEKK